MASPEAGTNSYGTPTATVLYQRSPAIVRRTMALDARDIFWMEVSLEYGNLVMAASKQGGGDVRTLGRWYDFGSSHSLSVDEVHAYWLRPDDDGVVIKVDKQGGPETSLPILRHDPAQSALNCIHIVGDVVWTASGGCTEIARMRTDGSNAQVWPIHDGRNEGVTTGFALHDEKVYCGNGALIYELDPATDEIAQVVTGQDHAGALLWVSSTLYFVDNSGVAGGNDRLKSWRPGEAEPKDLGPAFSFVGRLLHDEARNVIYWVRGGARRRWARPLHPRRTARARVGSRGRDGPCGARCGLRLLAGHDRGLPSVEVGGGVHYVAFDRTKIAQRLSLLCLLLCISCQDEKTSRTPSTEGAGSAGDDATSHSASNPARINASGSDTPQYPTVSESETNNGLLSAISACL